MLFFYKLNIKQYFIFSFFALNFNIIFGQIKEFDEDKLNAQTKLVSQFFKRFNNEENKYNIKYDKNSLLFRSNFGRKKMLKELFDKENFEIKDTLKNEFISFIANDSVPLFIEFFKSNWFAQVNANFLYFGKKEKIILFFKLETKNNASKWILKNIFFKKYYKNFYNSEKKEKKFISPISHELEFINLIKIFKDYENIEYYTSDNYEIDFLSIFLYDVKKENLKFVNIDNKIKFHFFQMENWYFSLSFFNRKNYNSGWLISDLIKINKKNKNIILNFISKSSKKIRKEE